MNPKLLLPSPSPEKLREFRRSRDWSAAQCARFFGYRHGRRWREFEAGERPLDAALWTLALLSEHEHPTYRLKRRLGELREVPAVEMRSTPRRGNTEVIGTAQDAA